MFPKSQRLLAFSIHVLFSLGCDPRFERSWYGLVSGVEYQLLQVILRACFPRGI